MKDIKLSTITYGISLAFLLQGCSITPLGMQNNTKDAKKEACVESQTVTKDCVNDVGGEKSGKQVSYKSDCATCGYKEAILFRECPNAKPDKEKISVFCCMECYSVWEAYKGEDGQIVSGERHFAGDKHEFIIDGEEYRLFEPEADWAAQCNYPLPKKNTELGKKYSTLKEGQRTSLKSSRKRKSLEQADLENKRKKNCHLLKKKNEGTSKATHECFDMNPPTEVPDCLSCPTGSMILIKGKGIAKKDGSAVEQDFLYCNECITIWEAEQDAKKESWKKKDEKSFFFVKIPDYIFGPEDSYSIKEEVIEKIESN